MTVNEMVVASSSGSDSESNVVTEESLVTLMEKTGYPITQENGQRKYGGPPPNWGNKPPPRGAEVFVGKIPRDVFEDELVPVFESAGRIYELRLMMDFDGKNRGYAFVMYYTKAEAKGAVKKLNNYEIRKGRLLGVCYSVDNCRLFVGGIPKSKKKDDILTEMAKVTEEVVDVIVYPSASDKTKNRGFAFVEYTSHRAAAMARRKLIPGRIQLWGHPIAVDWAEPEQEVDEDIMNQVKVLYVRNLMLDTTEDTLLNIFSRFQTGSVERVKKIRDYAFVHFSNRDTCMRAMKEINGTKIDGAEVEVTLAKPVDKNECNRMAKVGAKVLNHNNDNSSVMVQNSALPSNNVIVYQPGFYGNELVYYPISQTNIAPNVMPVRNGGFRNDKLRNSAGTRSGNNRGNYLGYSAGKATFGRYYSKSNSDRIGEVPYIDVYYDPTGNVSDPLVQAAMMNGASAGVNSIPTSPSLPFSPTAGPPHFPTPIPQPLPSSPTTKNADEILDALCQTSMWGTPSYQLFSSISSDGRVVYVYKVTIPAFANLFQPSKLCENHEDAKLVAAEHVLSCLGLHADGSPSMVPMTTLVNSAAAGFQAVYSQSPQMQIVPPNAPPSATPQCISTPTSTLPVTYVDPGSMMHPITVMYQQ